MSKIKILKNYRVTVSRHGGTGRITRNGYIFPSMDFILTTL